MNMPCAKLKMVWTMNPESEHTDCDGKRCSIQKGKVPFSMQTWPSYYCPPDPSAEAKTKSRKFDKSYSTVVDYGVIGAATLIQNGGRLEWGSLVSSRPSSESASYSRQ